MSIAILVSLVVTGAVVTIYLRRVPQNTFITTRYFGRDVTFSRRGIWLQPVPDRYPHDGFSHVASYVTRLVTPSRRRKAVAFFSAAGDRGFSVGNDAGLVDASLSVEWREEPEREAAIRTFFASLGISAWRDYLAGNGGVSDATRILHYRLMGDASEVSVLVKRILAELCGVSEADPLVIKYWDRLP
jgi:hypothetical protein